MRLAIEHVIQVRELDKQLLDAFTARDADLPMSGVVALYQKPRLSLNYKV